jgi:hypothetical protein
MINWVVETDCNWFYVRTQRKGENPGLFWPFFGRGFFSPLQNSERRAPLQSVADTLNRFGWTPADIQSGACPEMRIQKVPRSMKNWSLQPAKSARDTRERPFQVYAC